MARFTLNHSESKWEEGLTVASLIKRENFKFPMLVVKVGGKVIKKSEYEGTPIPEGSDVEIIHLISGG